MLYAANSFFEFDGVSYRPGETVPEISNAPELVEVGYIIAVPDDDYARVPAEDSDDNEVKKSGRKK